MENMDYDLRSVQEVRDMARLGQIATEQIATYTEEQIDRILVNMVRVAEEHAVELAQMAVEETGFGKVEDKTYKNHLASTLLYEEIKNMKASGILKEDPVNKVLELAEPVGLLMGIVPSTNPTSTAIFKSLLCLKTRNAIIISPHPRAKRSTIQAAQVVLDAAVAAGAPEGIIGWIDIPSLELTQTVMREADCILATGGPGMVKAAYSSGKPAIGVGAGNTPAIIDSSADILMAVSSVIHSKTFDNGMICASEQSVIVLDAIYDKVKAEFAEHPKEVRECSGRDGKAEIAENSREEGREGSK